MTATKVYSNQRVTVRAGLASGISDWSDVTLAEINALTNVSGATNWDSFDLNIQASEQKDDRTLTDAAGAQSRGFTQFGGVLEFVHPRPEDTASIYRTTYDIFATPRVELAVAVRYGPKNSLAAVAGEKWTLYHVIVDAPAIGQNDVSKYYKVTLVARDDILPNYIVPAASPSTVALTAVSATAAVGDLVFISAAYEGWDVTKSASYLSSDETKLEMVHPGIFLAKAAGAPTIIGRYPGAGDSTAKTITIT